MCRDSVIPPPPKDRKQLSSEDVGTRQPRNPCRACPSVSHNKEGSGNYVAALLEWREEGARACERGRSAEASASKTEDRGRTREGTKAQSVSCNAFYSYTRRARTSAARGARGTAGVGWGGRHGRSYGVCRHVQNEGLTKQIMLMTSSFPLGMRSADLVNRVYLQARSAKLYLTNVRSTSF